MKWSDFKEMEKSFINDKDSNAVQKFFNAAVIGPVVFAVDKADEVVENVTGKGVIDRHVEAIEKEEEEKENHTWKWAGKKLLQGTLGGIIGSSIHKGS